MLIHVGSSVSCFRVLTKTVLVSFHFVCVSVMDGLWSNPFQFPRVPDDEEIDGDTSLIGPGGLFGYDVHGDMYEDGLGQAITPFGGGEVQGELGSGGPISLIGNTRSMGHRDDLTKVMSPNEICRVCEYVARGFHCGQCTVCNHVVHPDCSTQFGMHVMVCHRCIGERRWTGCTR